MGVFSRDYGTCLKSNIKPPYIARQNVSSVWGVLSQLVSTCQGNDISHNRYQISQVVHGQGEAKEVSIDIVLVDVLLVGEPDQVSL